MHAKDRTFNQYEVVSKNQQVPSSRDPLLPRGTVTAAPFVLPSQKHTGLYSIAQM